MGLKSTRSMIRRMAVAVTVNSVRLLGSLSAALCLWRDGPWPLPLRRRRCAARAFADGRLPCHRKQPVNPLFSPLLFNGYYQLFMR